MLAARIAAMDRRSPIGGERPCAGVQSLRREPSDPAAAYERSRQGTGARQAILVRRATPHRSSQMSTHSHWVESRPGSGCRWEPGPTSGPRFSGSTESRHRHRSRPVCAPSSSATSWRCLCWLTGLPCSLPKWHFAGRYRWWHFIFDSCAATAIACGLPTRAVLPANFRE